MRRSTAGRSAWLAAVVVAALAACDGSSPTVPTGGETLALDQGVALQVSDTAVVVDGTVRVRLPSARQGLRIYHSTSYEYGGLGSYAPDRVWEEQWFSRFGYELPTVQRGDTVVYEYLDFGDVTLAGRDTLAKLTEPPDVSGAPYPVRYVNLVVYLGTHYAWRLEESGAEITFVVSDYLQRMLRGSPIAISATGGPVTAGFDTTFAIEALPTLDGMDNDGSLDFRSRRPIIDVDHDLGLSFDGAVDPEMALFALLPWHEDVPDAARRRAATVVGSLSAPAHRVVFPATVLAGLLDAAGVDEAGYILFVIRVRDTGDVIRSTRLDTGEELELGAAQMDDVRLLIRLTR